MPLIHYDSAEDISKTRVVTIHYRPDLLSEGERAEFSKEVPFVPEPEDKEGKYAVLYINRETNELWYEYYDAPLSEQERMELLERKLAQKTTEVEDLYLLMADFIAKV
ncbi:hypothetical protein D3P09_11735 [Paenibacillus pinisoli]|uniref:Uncharacterized protein n=1 Tax=Paenibacillus pinisoli TaxID=1276110 RepID=A0A3A6PPA6_9BACL|nr:hypothetical protein [Paenibacillus pinisoli]RJX40039.1 hypothetical protein D3P09_11735 [Paenibacillus pinisoli]